MLSMKDNIIEMFSVIYEDGLFRDDTQNLLS